MSGRKVAAEWRGAAVLEEVVWRELPLPGRWADVETAYQGRPKLCMWSLSFIAFSHCLKRKLTQLARGYSITWARTWEARAGSRELTRRPKLHQQEWWQNFSRKKIMFWTWLSGLIKLSGTSMQIGAVEMVLKPGCHRSWQDVISMADISLSKPLMWEIWIITSSALAVWITQLWPRTPLTLTMCTTGLSRFNIKAGKQTHL